MNLILGMNFLLGRVNGDGVFTSLAYSRSCAVKENREVKEVSSPSSEIWKEYIPARCSWTGTSENLLSSDGSELETAFRDGTPFLISFRERGTSGRQYRGYAIIKEIAIQARIGDVATYSISFQGTGPLDYTTITP